MKTSNYSLKQISSIRKPIGFKIFSVIILVILFQGVTLYAMFSSQFKNELTTNKIKVIQSLAINLQETLNHLANKKEKEQIQKTITSLGTISNLKYAILLNDKNNIIASTQIEFIGKSIDSLIHENIRPIIKSKINSAKHMLKNVIWQSENKDSLYLASPIILGQLSNNSIRPNKIGTLFLSYDMQWIDKKNKNTFTTIFLPMMILLSIAGLALGIYFNISIGKRIKLLNKYSKDFLSSNSKQRIPATGDDEITDLILAFNNMADEVQAQHSEILSREQNLAITLNSIGDAVITTDEKGCVTRMNPVAIELTGWTLQESLGKSINNIFPIINAATREPIPNPIEKVISTGKTVYLSNHTTLISKNKKEHQIADSAAPICDNEKNIRGMVLIFNDVTEQYRLREKRRESEERFKQISENVNEVFWIASFDWRKIFYVNPAYENLWGHTAEELYKKPQLWIDTVHPDDRTQVIEDMPNDLNSIGDYIDFRAYRIINSLGQTHWIKAKAYPIYNKDGVVTRIAGIAEDITKKVNMEETLRRTQKMDALGKITSGVAHDYNNMLGVILGYADLLENELKNQPKLKKYTDQILHAGHRGTRLTKKLLSFSRSRPLKQECIYLNELLENQKHMLEKTLTARVKLVFDLADRLWPIWVDVSEIEDAILNISINAMHAIEANGQFTISTRNVTLNEVDASKLSLSPGNYVSLSLTDTGCGMSEEIKDKVFDPFFSTKGERGTGLGLSQVYEFIQRSGAMIAAHSELGHGTQFELYFPQYQNDNKEDESPEKKFTSAAYGNETILVVDDEPALLSLSNEILSQHGFNVICANSAKQVLEILQHHKVDLLLSDIIMPEMDGYQLASIVNKNYPHIKIQLVSGFSYYEHIDMVDENLQKNLLAKPYKSHELLQKIHTLLST